MPEHIHPQIHRLAGEINDLQSTIQIAEPYLTLSELETVQNELQPLFDDYDQFIQDYDDGKIGLSQVPSEINKFIKDIREARSNIDHLIEPETTNDKQQIIDSLRSETSSVREGMMKVAMDEAEDNASNIPGAGEFYEHSLTLEISNTRDKLHSVINRVREIDEVLPTPVVYTIMDTVEAAEIEVDKVISDYNNGNIPMPELKDKVVSIRQIVMLISELFGDIEESFTTDRRVSMVLAMNKSITPILGWVKDITQDARQDFKEKIENDSELKKKNRWKRLI